jgi:hypothetical protein
MLTPELLRRLPSRTQAPPLYTCIGLCAVSASMPEKAPGQRGFANAPHCALLV